MQRPTLFYMNEQQSANDQTNGLFYRQIGTKSAMASNASLTSIPASLNAAYSEFQKREKNLNAERIKQYQAEMAQFVEEKNGKQADLKQLDVQKEFKNNQIDDKKAELSKIRNEGLQPDFLPLGIGAFILILLTFYLFLFYSSTGYSSFFNQVSSGIIPSSPIRPGMSGGEIAFAVLFPMIFISMGFIIHISLERKNYWWLAGILFFTLAFDAFMAYKIAENAYNNPEIPWEPNMAITSIDFYIIIAAGFVVYLIWGYLLNFVLNEWQKMQPDKLRQSAINNCQDEILKLTSELAEFENKINLLISQIENISGEISERQRKIGILQGGGIIINITALRGMVGEFMNGWNAIVSALFPEPSQADVPMKQAAEAAENWLIRIEEGLENK